MLQVEFIYTAIICEYTQAGCNRYKKNSVCYNISIFGQQVEAHSVLNGSMHPTETELDVQTIIEQ